MAKLSPAVRSRGTSPPARSRKQQGHSPAPHDKAGSTARWARTMVKVWISLSRAARGWEIVNFTGPAGRESRGVVDLLAIRKDHRTSRVPRGDLFEMILIQVKGGSAAAPTAADIDWLRAVEEYYHARAVVLAEWRRGSAPVSLG